MQRRMQLTGITAITATVVLSVMRLIWRPQGSTVSGGYAAMLCVAAVVLVALFFLNGNGKRRTEAVLGVPAILSAAAMAVTGVALLLSALGGIADWQQGVYPYPQPVTAGTVAVVLAWVMFLSGALGGVFYLLTAARWLTKRRTDCCAMGLPALLPVVWSWARILWYMTSFASAVNRFRSVTEVAMLLFEMLFLFVFARHIAGMEETAPRYVFPVALAEAMLGLIVFVTRIGALVTQDAELFSGTALVTTPDMAVTLLAVVFVVGQMMPSKYVPADATTEPQPLSEPVVSVEEDDEGEAVPVLLREEDFLEEDVPSQEQTPTEQRPPLELEDILNELIDRNR